MSLKSHVTLVGGIGVCRMERGGGGCVLADTCYGVAFPHCNMNRDNAVSSCQLGNEHRLRYTIYTLYTAVCCAKF